MTISNPRGSNHLLRMVLEPKYLVEEVIDYTPLAHHLMFGESGSLGKQKNNQKTAACAQLAQLGDTLDISLMRFRAPWKPSLPARKRNCCFSVPLRNPLGSKHHPERRVLVVLSTNETIVYVFIYLFIFLSV